MPASIRQDLDRNWSSGRLRELGVLSGSKRKKSLNRKVHKERQVSWIYYDGSWNRDRNLRLRNGWKMVLVVLHNRFMYGFSQGVVA
jgi:hypothetical protein